MVREDKKDATKSQLLVSICKTEISKNTYISQLRNDCKNTCLFLSSHSTGANARLLNYEYEFARVFITYGNLWHSIDRTAYS